MSTSDSSISLQRKFIKFLYLRQNMRLGHSEADNQHAQWLLEIGAGSTMDDNEMIQVPQSIVCTNLNALINRIYPGISNTRAQADQYFLDRIILCPRNDEVHNINEAILQQFNPNAEVHMLRSVDSVSEEDGMHHVSQKVTYLFCDELGYSFKRA